MRLFSLIATPNNPISIKIIREIQRLNLNITNIYLVGKKFSSKDIKILKERTGKQFTQEYLKNIKKENIKKIYRFNTIDKFYKFFAKKKIKEDFFVNSGYVSKVPKKIIDLPKIGILNAHPGILPYFKGSCCPEWSLLLKKKVGITVHLMNTKIDAGPIYKKKIVDKVKYKNCKYKQFRKIVFKEQITFLCKCLGELIILKNVKKKFKPQIKLKKFFKPISNLELKKVKAILKYEKSF